MVTLTNEFAVPLGHYIKGFPPLQRLHPFEQAMLELTCGRNPYERALAKVDSLRKSILEVRYIIQQSDSQSVSQPVEGVLLSEGSGGHIDNVNSLVSCMLSKTFDTSSHTC